MQGPQPWGRCAANASIGAERFLSSLWTTSLAHMGDCSGPLEVQGCPVIMQGADGTGSQCKRNNTHPEPLRCSQQLLPKLWLSCFEILDQGLPI